MKTKSPAYREERPSHYESFDGLDTFRDDRTQETGKNQVLTRLNNGFCDAAGQIVRDPGLVRVMQSPRVVHIRYFQPEQFAFVYQTGKALSLASTRAHTRADVYPPNAVPDSTIFNSQLFVGAAGLPTYRYDGNLWSPCDDSVLNVTLFPAYFATSQRRLIVSGIPRRTTQVHLSRVDSYTVFPDNEEPSSDNVLRAGYIDIANFVGRAENITGISPFEQNRLAIFTPDRMLLYVVDPSIDNWTMDDRANVKLGCVSQATIVEAGTDLIFCSRSGIHSVQRSRDNGILVFSRTLSSRIETLYLQLVASVPDPSTISAVWDQDRAQYHVFFPQPGDIYSKRLTLSLNPVEDSFSPKWSLGTFLNATCADFLGGQLVYGTSDGVYRQLLSYDDTAEVTPELDVLTPLLWHNDPINLKESTTLLLQAHGSGTLLIEAYDDTDALIWSDTLEVEATPDDNFFSDVPLSRQYIRKFERRYRGVRFRFKCAGNGLFRIHGFSVMVRNS